MRGGHRHFTSENPAKRCAPIGNSPFQGQSVAELTKAFRDSVDDYLEFCKQRGDALEKPFSSQFVTWIPPELHRQVQVAAVISGKSLNAWVTEQLQNGVKRVVVKAAGKRAGSKAKAVKKAAKRKKDIKHD